jgi:hypothetical protein
MAMSYRYDLQAIVFDRMELLESENARLRAIEAQRLKDRQAARLESPELTEALKSIRESQGKETKNFHYSNEFNLINKIVLGVTSKQYINEHGMLDGDSIRDSMRPMENKAISELQRANSSFIDMGLEYNERKKMLGKLYERKFKQALIDEVFRVES